MLLSAGVCTLENDQAVTVRGDSKQVDRTVQTRTKLMTNLGTVYSQHVIPLSKPVPTKQQHTAQNCVDIPD